MSEHTPGPWMVVDAHNMTQISAVSQSSSASGDGRKGIADLFDSRDGIPEWRANARLIAAAPDMLAELKRLIDVVGDEDASCIEAIIAKAEGKP